MSESKTRMSEKKKSDKAAEPVAEEPEEVAEPKDAAPPKKKAKKAKGAAEEEEGEDGAEEDAAAPSKGGVGRGRIHGKAQEAKVGLKDSRKKKAPEEPAEAKEPPAKKAKKAQKAKKPKAAPKKQEKKVVDNKPRQDDQMMNLRRVCRWLIGGSSNANLKKMCEALGLPATGSATVLKNKLEDGLAAKNFPKNKTFKPSVAETEMDDDTFNALMEKNNANPLTIRNVCEALAKL